MNSVLERHALSIFLAGIDAVRPERLLAREEVDALLIESVANASQVFVLGFGKAAAAMAVALERVLPAPPAEGAVIVPESYLTTLPPDLRPRTIQLLPGGHPHPTAASVASARHLMHLADTAQEQDLVIVLVSGGGSALFADFSPGISLDDAREVNRLLLGAGASIDQINVLRKHLSCVSGGRLAAASHPARCLTLAISDVPGDDPAVIASGPTVADPSTFADALAVIDALDIRKRLPRSVTDHLERGIRGMEPESVKSGDLRLERSSFHLLGGNADALRAASDLAAALGYRIERGPVPLEGEAADAGRTIARYAVSADVPEPTCWLYGGETTVTLQDESGTGGRNQELALAASRVLSACDDHCVLLAGGTDGIDGPTDAAGGLVTARTADAALLQDLDIDAALRRHDAYGLLERLDALVFTGPTHTNVMDLVIALRAPESS